MPIFRPVASGRMLFRLRGIAGLAAAALLALALVPAEAQTPTCDRIRAELASLPRGNVGGDPREAQSLRAEIGKIRLAMRNADCDRSSFLGFGGPPPVCAPLRGQLNQYEARLQAVSGGGNPRQAQLMAALQQYGCVGGRQQAAPQQRGVIYAGPQAEEPSLFDRIFGGGTSRSSATVDDGGNPIDQPIDPDAEAKERLGGRMAVCVRTCDGFFFPVNFEGLRARDEYDQVCKALCPSAETQIFFMSNGADISKAAARDGTPYMSMHYAKKFQQSRDPACFCKPQNATWANLAKSGEDIVEARKGDLVVTPEQAAAMSRPKAAPAPKGSQARGRNAPPEPQPDVDGESVAASPPQGAAQAQRNVRNVAPGLAGTGSQPGQGGAARP